MCKDKEFLIRKQRRKDKGKEKNEHVVCYKSNRSNYIVPCAILLVHCL